MENIGDIRNLKYSHPSHAQVQFEELSPIENETPIVRFPLDLLDEESPIRIEGFEVALNKSARLSAKIEGEAITLYQVAVIPKWLAKTISKGGTGFDAFIAANEDNIEPHTVFEAISNARYADPDHRVIEYTRTIEGVEAQSSLTRPDAGEEATLEGRLTNALIDRIIREAGEVADYTPPPPPTREELRAALPDLTPRQLRLGLVRAGIKTSDVDAAIAQIEDETARTVAETEWEYATYFPRMNPTIDALGVLLGLDADNIDDLWRASANI